MYHAFNMGIGMAVIMDKSITADFQSAMLELTFIIGEVVEGERKVILN